MTFFETARTRKLMAGLLLITLVIGVAAWLWWGNTAVVNNERYISLLLPDQHSEQADRLMAIWSDAAAEEGLLLKPISYWQWIDTQRNHRSALQKQSALIVPDELFRNPPIALNDALNQFVTQGGALMLVYDAGLNTATAQQAGSTSDNALENISGVSLVNGEDQWSELESDHDFFRRMGVPPGRTIPKPSPFNSLSGKAFANPSDTPFNNPDRHIEQAAGYSYRQYTFPGLPYRQIDLKKATPLMWFLDGRPAVTYARHGHGQVLRINLPLTHLTRQTDGIWLHGLLRYFAQTLLGFPVLSGVSEGIGGLILNFHCDAQTCEEPMRKLDAMGIFDHGPYSIHVTAGPGQRNLEDGLGLDLKNNKPFKAFLKKLQQKGHMLGSHGGWIHDEFAVVVNENNAQQYLPYLEKNKVVIEAIKGSPQTEYSSPGANNPAWVIDWLEKTHVRAYYTTAHIGMGPTRAWHDKTRDPTLWSFPVLSMGPIATAEDAVFANVPENVFSAWLTNVLDFCVETGSTRLVYFHPLGANMMRIAIQHLVDKATDDERHGIFKWRTMTDQADFMNRRAQVSWHLDQQIQSGHQQLHASHPQNLENMTWLFNKRHFKKPTILKGQAQIFENRDAYRVVAGAVPTLVLDIAPQTTLTP